MCRNVIIFFFFIITAPKFSEEFIQFFHKSKQQFVQNPKPKSPDAIWKKFDEELSTISCKPLSMGSTQVMIRKKEIQSKYEEAKQATNRFSTVDFDYNDFDTIQLIIQRMHKGTFTASTQPENSIVAILNTSSASESDLRSLLGQFVPSISESATIDEIMQRLSQFIPMATVQSPAEPKFSNKCCASCSRKPHWFTGKFSTCYWCNRQFCKQCPLGFYQFPRIGTESRSLCNQCVQDLSMADANDWAEASIRFLSKTDDKSIIASLGCASVAMALGADSLDLLKNMAKVLHGKGLHGLAMNILSLAITRSSYIGSNQQVFKIHLLASSILKDLAMSPRRELEDKWCLALASKEAFITAVSMIEDGTTEILSDKPQEISKLLEQLKDAKKSEHDRKVLQYTKNLETLWSERNISGILNYLKEMNTTRSDAAAIIEADESLLAFQSFLQNKEPYLSLMQPDDRHALLLLRGILKLKEKDFNAALANLELAVWKSSHSSVPEELISSIFLYMLSEPKSELFAFTALSSALQKGSKAILFSPAESVPGDKRSKSLLFPSNKELTPPFEANWPELSVAGHNTRCHKKYEDAVMKLFKEKKWTYSQVAWAYIDQIPGCEHPAEIVVCSLHAAMWMARNINPTSKANTEILFAHKSVIMRLLKQAYAIALRFLNPGMELYTIRLVVGIMRKIAQMPNSSLTMTSDDSQFLHIMLKRLTKVSRLFPFREFPSVSVSEAALLSILTRNLHRDYILGLQAVEQDNRPLTNLELKYQLYENDLRGISPLENSSDSSARAMEELLLSQGWNWNDVVSNMSSPLTPRDSEGWLIQTPYLGVPQEYSEITGFVVDTDNKHPSLQLRVIKADPRKGRVGLFSQEDINDILQLDISDLPLFFSLDPPEDDLDKRYHPFQQWRYPTELLKDTEIMKTIFMTDYLMKTFTVGSDVSAVPPFNQRPCKEGLTKHLPPKLQEAIRSIHERGGIHSNDSMHRFWIEAKSMKYDCKQDGSKLEFHFGEMEMIVKSHSLMRHVDGELKDTDENNDPDSPHTKFAEDMTNSYTELSQYFPVFARLRQLSKLQVFLMMLHSVLQNMKESSQEKNIKIPEELVKMIQDDVRSQHQTNLSRALSETKREIGVWPKAQDSLTVQAKVREIKREIRNEISREEARLRSIHGYNIIVDNSDAMRMLNNVESQVINALKKNDEDILSQIVEAFGKSCGFAGNHQFKQYVREWLQSDDRYTHSFRISTTPRDKLMTYICSRLPVPTYNDILKSVIDHHSQNYEALLNLLNSFKYKNTHRVNKCKWVPAAVSKESLSISYGGVAFIPQITQIKANETIPGSTGVPVTIKRQQPHTYKMHQIQYVAPKGNAQAKSFNRDSSSKSAGKSSSSGSDSSSSSSSATNKSDEKSTARRSECKQPAEKQMANIKSIITPVKQAKLKLKKNINTGSSKDVEEKTASFTNAVDDDSLGRLAVSKPTSHGAGSRGVGKAGGRGSGKSGGGGSGKGGGGEGGGGKGGGGGSGKGGGGGSGKGGGGGGGLYIIKFKGFKERYVGRTCDIDRRTKEHKGSIVKGTDTVGKFCEENGLSVDDIEIEFRPMEGTRTEMRYQEQKLMNEQPCTINKIAAMNRKAYKIETKKRNGALPA